MMIAINQFVISAYSLAVVCHTSRFIKLMMKLPEFLAKICYPLKHHDI
jgi:hypothetical protein